MTPTKGKHLDTNTHTDGAWGLPCEVEGRDQCEACSCHATPKTAGKPSRSSARGMEETLPQLSEGASTEVAVIPELGEDNISIVEKTVF